MAVLVADLSKELEKDIDLSNLETALRDTVSFMLKSYHAPLMGPRDQSVVGEIERSDVRRTLEHLIVRAPIELPGVDISLCFNEKYAPDDSMTFDFLRIKMRDGHSVPLERLYEVLGRREIIFQPEKSIGSLDTFNYNHLMDCLFDQRGMPDLKVKGSGSRMLIWRPDNITTENYLISADRAHRLIPEHLRNPLPVQVSEGWSAVKLVPHFQSDGKQQRVVHLSVSDEQGVEIINSNAVRFYAANYPGFTRDYCGWGQGGMIVYTLEKSRSHLNVDRFVAIEARNSFFYQQDSRAFPVYDELLVPLPRFWRMTDLWYGDHTGNIFEQFTRIVDYLSETLSYVLVSSQDELAQSQVRYASFAYGLEDLKRTSLRTIAEGVTREHASPEEVVQRMSEKYQTEQANPKGTPVQAEKVVGTISESQGLYPKIAPPPTEKTDLPQLLTERETVQQPEPATSPQTEGERVPEQPSSEKGSGSEVLKRDSRIPWYIAGVATLTTLIIGGYTLLRAPERVYIRESVPAYSSSNDLPVQSDTSSLVEQQQDHQGKYIVITNDAPLRDTLDSVLKDLGGSYLPFSGRTLGDVDISELTIRASNGNFLLDRGYVGGDGNYYIGLLQVSADNPRRTGNPGSTVWKNSTFSNALMLTSWYKSPESEEEAAFIYGKVAEVLQHTFPRQGFEANNLEIKGENLEVYVKKRTPEMNNVDSRTNRITIGRDDVVVMPVDDLKARTIER